MISLKKIILFIIIFMGLPAVALAQAHSFHEKQAFWDQLRKGTNIFNQTISPADIKAAKAYGVAFIRLAPDKFITSRRDFLIGNADHYQSLIKQDLEHLKHILDLCAKEKISVVLTMLSLPGSRWKQNNHDRDDGRIWYQLNFQKQSAQFWRDIALALKDHPAIVGYNILNEPHLEKFYRSANQKEIQSKLFYFYQRVIQSIRSVDPYTPIILDSSEYADAKSFAQFKIFDDPYIIYSFHMYEPYEYTNYQSNKGRFTYPGKIANHYWNKKALQIYLSAVLHFQQKYHIPSNRILVGEFGGHRSSVGLAQYFTDLIDIFKQQNWHFAFYAFREDTWDGMDYELGGQKLPWTYWQAIEKGEKPTLKRNATYPPFKILKEALNT